MKLTQSVCVTYAALISLACSSGARLPAAAGEGRPNPEVKEVHSELPPLEGSGQASLVNTGPTLGDKKVHEYRGSLQKKPLRLVQEVVARTYASYTLEYTLCQLGDNIVQSCPERLRVSFSLPSQRVLKVHRFDGQTYVPASEEDYQKLFDKTLVASERNLGLVEEYQTVCLIGTSEVACKKTHYSILLKGEKAELIVARGAQGDLSGEVRALDGSVLYHSELVELSQKRDVAPSQNGREEQVHLER